MTKIELDKKMNSSGINKKIFPKSLHLSIAKDSFKSGIRTGFELAIEWMNDSSGGFWNPELAEMLEDEAIRLNIIPKGDEHE